jgi:hypothetical protein
VNDEQFSEIISKLDLMTNALLLNLVKDLDFKDKVLYLSKIGMKEADIVKLLGEKRPRVHSVLQRMKKK